SSPKSKACCAGKGTKWSGVECLRPWWHRQRSAPELFLIPISSSRRWLTLRSLTTTLTGCLLAVAPSTARLTLNSEFQGTLRRLKPQKHRTPLKPRPESELDFIESTGSWTTKLLYDTTVYRSEEHTSELQSRVDLVCRLLLEKKN